MIRWLAVFSLVAACGAQDDRPETLAYITDAILVPYCGRAGCHSASTAARNLKFDNVDDSLAALRTRQGRRGTNMPMITIGEPSQSRIYTVLQGTTNGNMPPDQPLADADVALIGRWITDGAEGYSP
jgi:hypothetical protein